MNKIVDTFPRIGDGTDDNPFRPDVDFETYKGYKVLEEHEDSFVVEVFERG